MYILLHHKRYLLIKNKVMGIRIDGLLGAHAFVSFLDV
jgi:hypothetical protein